MNCHCCSGPTKKFGRFENVNRIVQRYRCTRCGKTFSENQPLQGVRIDAGKAAQVVSMLCEGLGMSAAARLASVNQKTVANILETAGRHCADFLDQKLMNLKAEPLEIDECWTFVDHKRARGNSPDQGDFFTFLASGQNSKLIVSHLTAKRDNDTSRDFIQDIASRMLGQIQITSDGWTGFIRGVLENLHHRCDYAVQIKKYDGYNSTVQDSEHRYSPGKCCKLQTIIPCGKPDKDNICTSHAERLNLSLRHFNKRFTRLTPCYSKKLECLIDSVALTVAHFNFCRVHSAVKIKATDTEKAIQRTPAMAAGLTDHVWTVSELLEAKI